MVNKEMNDLNFKTWFEATDIFGFDPEIRDEAISDNMLARPISQFNIELMMEFLNNKRVGLHAANCPFVNEIQWGTEPGSAIKLEVDTGYSFHLKKLVVDLQGQKRWITKKLFQLNRHGYGGHEDSVASEVHEHIQKAMESPMESPVEEYGDGELQKLVVHLAGRIRRVAKEVFLYQGVKKVDENNYLIMFECRGGGVEAPDQRRVEKNLTQVTYDKEGGTIRIQNYNVESPVGGPHEWAISPQDIDLYFLPTQPRDEIAEVVGVHFKYY